MCAGRVQCGVGKILKRATSLVQTLSRSEVGARNYDVPKSWESKTETVSGLHFGSPGKKCHSDASAAERHKKYYRGRWWWHLPSPGRGVSCESELARGLSQHQMHAEWVKTNLCWFFMQVRDQIVWSFPSLISGLLARPSTPF
jgi:hypothetical protein